MNRTTILEELKKVLAPYMADKEKLPAITEQTDLIKDLQALGKQAFFEENRQSFLEAVRSHLSNDCVLLLMGARDPSLEYFAKDVYAQL